jgi:hypothetical protein
MAANCTSTPKVPRAAKSRSQFASGIDESDPLSAGYPDACEALTVRVPTGLDSMPREAGIPHERTSEPPFQINRSGGPGMDSNHGS